VIWIVRHAVILGRARDGQRLRPPNALYESFAPPVRGHGAQLSSTAIGKAASATKPRSRRCRNCFSMATASNPSAETDVADSVGHIRSGQVVSSQ
jgi:hypothetical protein